MPWRDLIFRYLLFYKFQLHVMPGTWDTEVGVRSEYDNKGEHSNTWTITIKLLVINILIQDFVSTGNFTLNQISLRMPNHTHPNRSS